MRYIKPLLIVLSAAIVTSPVVEAHAATGLKLCLSAATGAITSRPKCKKNETALSLSTLTTKITEQQGGAGSEFSSIVTEGATSDVTIPGATTIPGAPPIVIHGSLRATATCSKGFVFASSCESATLTNLAVGAIESADGTSVECTWENSSAQAIVGRYYARVVCADL